MDDRDENIVEILTDESPVLPDYAMLSHRLYVTDGGHVNKVILDGSGSWRPMGAREQPVPLDLEYQSGGPLEAGSFVTYAMRRVIVARGVETTGGMLVETIRLPASGSTYAVSMMLTPYEFTLGKGVYVKYEIFRSKKENTQLLYRVASLSEVSGRYTDLCTEANLPADFSINLDADGMDLTIPPCRYVRAWRGSLVCGGYRRRTTSVSGTSGSSLLTVEEGVFTVDDIGCFLTIKGEKYTHQIVEIVDAITIKVASVLSASHEPQTGTNCTVWRDEDIVYVSRPLPDNIEVYSAENGRLISNQGSDNTITGIAVNGPYAYVFRQNTVEIITGTPSAPELEPFPGSPPGCRSHATIVDRYSPFILYYAGVCGVWMIAGQEASRVSTKIDFTIKNEIDHSQDQQSHAVYDPATGIYWLFVFSKHWRETGIRMPDMLLIYDTKTKAWTRGELSASRSGLWRNNAGDIIPVFGVPNGVAQLGLGDEDGQVEVEGVVEGRVVEGSGSDNSGDGNWYVRLKLEGVSADDFLRSNEEARGRIFLAGDMSDVTVRFVSEYENGVVTVYGELPGNSVGKTVMIGYGSYSPEGYFWDRNGVVRDKFLVYGVISRVFGDNSFEFTPSERCVGSIIPGMPVLVGVDLEKVYQACTGTPVAPIFWAEDNKGTMSDVLMKTSHTSLWNGQPVRLGGPGIAGRILSSGDSSFAMDFDNGEESDIVPGMPVFIGDVSGIEKYVLRRGYTFEGGVRVPWQDPEVKIGHLSMVDFHRWSSSLKNYDGKTIYIGNCHVGMTGTIEVTNDSIGELKIKNITGNNIIGNVDSMQFGMTVLVGDDVEDLWFGIVKGCSGGQIEIYGDMPENCEGKPVRIGSVFDEFSGETIVFESGGGTGGGGEVSNSMIVRASSGNVGSVVPGMPIFVGDMPNVEKRIVLGCAGSRIFYYGAPLENCEGKPVRIGSIRWSLTTPEIGISGYFDRYLKLETLSVNHGKSAKPLPVRFQLTGINEISDDEEDEQVWEDRVDFSTRSISRVDGRATGLRAASVQFKCEGLSAPALIKAIRIDMTKVAR